MSVAGAAPQRMAPGDAARADRDDGAVAPLDALPPLASAALLRGHNVVRIEHNGSFYQLRSTRLGKLILTK